MESLDTTHERFSFYQIFGFAAVMPMIWTLQTQYLAYHPITLSWLSSFFNSAIFSAGWALNHYTNSQRALCRETGGNCTIWGQKARYIEAKYETADGKIHRTQLLCSGTYIKFKTREPLSSLRTVLTSRGFLSFHELPQVFQQCADPQFIRFVGYR